MAGRREAAHAVSPTDPVEVGSIRTQPDGCWL